MQSIIKKDSVFYYLLFLTLFFMLIEVSFFIQCNNFYLSEFAIVTHKLHVPSNILPGVAYSITVQLLIHFFFCCTIWIVTKSLQYFLKLSNNHLTYLAIILWFIGITTIIVANQYYFPNSKFSEISSFIFFNSHVTKWALLFLFFIDLLLIIATFIRLTIFLIKKSLYYILIFFCFNLGFLVYLFSNHDSFSDGASSTKPNIIFIGVDSLRPDFLSFFGYHKNTPFFDSFLKEAAVFNGAITPLARTFPSWTSILTGLYPIETNIRTNLEKQPEMYESTLPLILKQQGYQTIFATDETRFSNIDKRMGFDKIVTPPIGLNDFLIGTFNDFPISNLIINSFLGKWLFPYSFANRPVFFTYDPDSFIELLKPTIKSDRKKPTFLAVHFCLTHYPYLWGGYSGFVYTDAVERYAASIQRVDRQIQDFFILLKTNGWLNHAIVVLLSDHGEALELAGDRITDKNLFINSHYQHIPLFYPPSYDQEGINQSAGHGTDVLGLTQYHTILAFKNYNQENYYKGIINGNVSLLDIKPTILSLLSLPSMKTRGKSLVTAIRTGQAIRSKNDIFFESDFSPEAIRTVYPEERKALLEGIEMFQIDTISSRLIVKEEMKKKIISSKQYADLFGDWVLALYPQKNHIYMPILVNRKTGRWTNDLTSTFANHSPAQHMLTQLRSFYGNEISEVLLNAQN